MLRGLAILGGVALIEQFHFVIYVLGVLLLVLAYRILKGVAENVDPDKNFIVRLVRRVFPVTSEYHGRHWFVRQEGTRYATPLFLCLAAIVAADIAFAVDSIPAAFAITRDSVLIWMGNIFALLGMRALFVLVEGLIRRFRYLDETIAFVLAAVAIKLLIEDLYKIGPGGLARDRRPLLRGRHHGLADRGRARSRRRGQAGRALTRRRARIRARARAGRDPLGASVVVVRVGVRLELVLLLDHLVVVQLVALPGADRADLEALEQLVALRVVERDLVADEDPLAVVDVVGELGARMGRVVDDDQDLGLGVEVRPRTGGELVEVEAAEAGHAPQCKQSSAKQRSLTAGCRQTRSDLRAGCPQGLLRR